MGTDKERIMKKTRIALLALFAAIVLVVTGCASTETVEAVKTEASYEIVGYRYVFAVDGNTVEVDYVDWYGDEEIKAMEDAFMAMIPNAVSASNPAPGRIVITSKNNISAKSFDAFVEQAKELVYNQIY